MSFEHFGSVLDAYELPHSLYLLYIRYAELVAIRKQEEVKRLETQVKKTNINNQSIPNFRMPF